MPSERSNSCAPASFSGCRPHCRVEGTSCALSAAEKMASSASETADFADAVASAGAAVDTKR